MNICSVGIAYATEREYSFFRKTIKCLLMICHLIKDDIFANL